MEKHRYKERFKQTVQQGKAAGRREERLSTSDIF